MRKNGVEMLKVTICIGSSCHIKGSHYVVSRLRGLIAENNIGNKVDLEGSFCLGKCQEGVCVLIGETIYSVTPANVDEFFENSILKAV